MEPLEALALALVPGVTPGKWLDRWQERRPDVPFTVDIVPESAQFEALADHQLLFARTGSEGIPPHFTRELLTIPLYEEIPVAVLPRDHEITLAEECPVAALAGEDLLDVALLGYEQALELAGNGAGIAVVPQAVARLLARKDTVALPLTETAPEDLGLTSRSEHDGGLAPREASRLLETTRVWLCFHRSWQDDHGDNHPVIEEFIGIVRGRKAESSRQPSVQQRQQEEARRRLKERQSSEGAAKKDPGTKKAGGTPKRTARRPGTGKPATGSRGRKRGQR